MKPSPTPSSRSSSSRSPRTTRSRRGPVRAAKLRAPRNFRRPAMLSQRLYYLGRRSAMAQVITRCRLTGHYMFMGMDVDPKEFTRSPGPFTRKFCPFCACDHLWHKEDSKFLAPAPERRDGVREAG